MIVLYQSLLDLWHTPLPKHQSDTAVVAHHIILNAERAARSQQSNRAKKSAKPAGVAFPVTVFPLSSARLRFEVNREPPEELVSWSEWYIIRNDVIDQPHILALADDDGTAELG